MFPEIRRIEDLMPFVGSNQQIRVKDCELTGSKIVSYMVQDEDTFVGEHEHYERECRGITFDANGTISARTLHKFFNIGQREDVQPQNLIWQNVTRIMEKRDGSMVTPVLAPKVFNLEDGSKTISLWPKFKTKKSFTTKEADLADLVMARLPGGTQWVSKILCRALTPTFEITSPQFPIVLKYEKEELTLLHVRENVSGRYLSEAEILELDSPFPIVKNLIEQFYGDGIPANLVSWEKLKVYAETATGVEGVVIQFGQEMVKLKTVWYCELHRSVTFTRWRDIARSVVADQADDLKGAFALTGRSIEPVVRVERKIKETIEHAQARVWHQVEEGRSKSFSPKDMALALREHPLFGQIMTTFRGKTVNWMEWYDRNHLDQDWGLEVVGDEE